MFDCYHIALPWEVYEGSSTTMSYCKRIILAILAMAAISLPYRLQAAPPVALNAEGDSGDALSISKIVQKMKDATPPLQDKYLEVKNATEYATLRQSSEWRDLRRQTALLRSVNLKEIDADSAKIAFWVNVYNVLVADGIVSLRVKGSVLKTQNFFANASYNVGGYIFSLEEIEHGILRGNRPPEPDRRPPFDSKDPRLSFAVAQPDSRIHFALNCGARSCPPVNIYTSSLIDEQLDSAARNFINGPDVRINEVNNQVSISKIFEWYATDFGTSKKEVLQFIIRFIREPLKSRLSERLDRWKISYLPYDWALVGKSK